MVKLFLKRFRLTPDIQLNTMVKGQSLNQLTIKLLSALEKTFLKEKPDYVVVQGDTASAMTGALTAFYQKIKVVHVEAGLRTFNKYSPFPEEIYRRIVSPIAEYHFAPTMQSKKNLIAEKISPKQIWITGNTGIDNLFIWLKQVPSQVIQRWKNYNRFILVTTHRREHFDGGFDRICQSILQLAKKNLDFKFILPVHLNPIVREKVLKYLGNHPQIHLTEPLDYFDLIHLMQKCFFIMTDSGGIQEEAPSLGKPVLVLRENSERPEGIAAGNAVLVGTDIKKITTFGQKLIDNKSAYQKMAKAKNPYGDGKAAEKILEVLKKY
jgi:UDP-N-acetylglucosamine 2-epimerase (non-hydrolysing)